MGIDWRDSKNGGDAEFDVVKKMNIIIVI